jgi:aspartyl protease family protein
MLATPLKLSLAVLAVSAILAQAVLHYRARPAAVHTVASATKPAPTAAPAVPLPRPTTHGTLESARGEFRIAADAAGQYSAMTEINGAQVRMLVDTGASSVALSYEDAAALGLYPAPAEYTHSVSTANGVGRVAPVKLAQIRVGPVVAYNVDAFVGERGALSTSLLGMTFLSKLSKVEVASGALVLRQ